MTDEIRKQISLFLPVSDWKILRLEAARRRLPITESAGSGSDRTWTNSGVKPRPAGNWSLPTRDDGGESLVTAELSQRSFAHPVVPDRTAPRTRTATRSALAAAAARSHQRHQLSLDDRLLLADAAPRLAPLGSGLCPLPPLAERRHAQTTPRRTDAPGANPPQPIIGGRWRHSSRGGTGSAPRCFAHSQHSRKARR